VALERIEDSSRDQVHESAARVASRSVTAASPLAIETANGPIYLNRNVVTRT
jgi:hypothetical protein